MTGSWVIASVIIAAALSPLAFLAPYAVVTIIGIMVIPSIIFLGIEETRKHRSATENKMRTFAGVVFIVGGILGALCSIAAA